MATSSAAASVSDSGAGLVPLVGRILIAAIFLLSGFSKVAGPAAAIAYINSAHLPLPSAAFGIAVLIELGGGILLVIGYRTRIVATILALFAIVTALAFHNNLADQGQFINFFKNIAMAGGLLQVVAFGAGRLSLDARR